MNQQLVYTKNTGTFTTSRILAKIFNKRHEHIIRKIDNLIKDLDKFKYPKNGGLKFIKIKETYRGNIFEVYEMSREAFSLLVMSFTGKRH